MRRGAIIVAVGLLLLSGCAALPGTSSVACVSWAVYDSDEERARDADAVLVVTGIEPDGTSPVYGFDANAYTAVVVAVEKGDERVGDAVRIASTADNCAARPYGEGDPMLSAETLRVFLTRDGDMLRTLSPFDGVAAAD